MIDETDVAETSSAQVPAGVTIATGLVHPVAGAWYFEEPLRPVFGGVTWTIAVRASQFHVRVEHSAPRGLAPLADEVQSVVQACLDALGFQLGTPLRAELLSVVDERLMGAEQPGWTDPLAARGGRVTVADLAPSVDAALGDTYARHAMADLRMALDLPEETSYYCYRAVESVRQAFLSRDGAAAEDAYEWSWQEMHAVIGTAQRQLAHLQRAAESRRGSGMLASTEAERGEALAIARHVLTRFVQHRSGADSADGQVGRAEQDGRDGQLGGRPDQLAGSRP